ncbi:MAG: DUF502 domain-containing protein [Proteobacteria bacterium]|nr:DUF502 domain-containing protein [Pseudomonadota bacterium]MBU1710098.1 DUF502 domain-containing protein [Pseudomonadota bacterium]
MKNKLNHFLEQKLKTYFITGLLVVGPIGLTIMVVHAVVSRVDILFYKIIPPFLQPERLLGFKIPGLGIIISILLIILTGMLTANFIGRLAVGMFERFMYRIPLIKSIYTLFKQVADTTFGQERKGFRKVVLIEYPRRGIWAIGFVTGITKGEVQRITDKKVINVFLPTTPNPTSGFYILVPEEEMVSLDMTTDEAFKLIISGGMVVPPDKGQGIAVQPAAPPSESRDLTAATRTPE